MGKTSNDASKEPMSRSKYNLRKPIIKLLRHLKILRLFKEVGYDKFGPPEVTTPQN